MRSQCISKITLSSLRRLFLRVRLYAASKSLPRSIPFKPIRNRHHRVTVVEVVVVDSPVVAVIVPRVVRVVPGGKPIVGGAVGGISYLLL